MSLSSTVSWSNGELLRQDRLFSVSAYIHHWLFSSRLCYRILDSSHYRKFSVNSHMKCSNKNNKQNKQPTKNKSSQCVQLYSISPFLWGMLHIIVFRSMCVIILKEKYTVQKGRWKTQSRMLLRKMKKPIQNAFAFPWVTKCASFCPLPAAFLVASNISRLVTRFREQTIRYQSFWNWKLCFAVVFLLPFFVFLFFSFKKYI